MIAYNNVDREWKQFANTDADLMGLVTARQLKRHPALCGTQFATESEPLYLLCNIHDQFCNQRLIDFPSIAKLSGNIEGRMRLYRSDGVVGI
jgi:hypothetical protein